MLTHYGCHAKIFVNGTMQAENLRLLAMADELSQIYNRRGFLFEYRRL